MCTRTCARAQAHTYTCACACAWAHAHAHVWDIRARTSSGATRSSSRLHMCTHARREAQSAASHRTWKPARAPIGAAPASTARGHASPARGHVQLQAQAACEHASTANRHASTSARREHASTARPSARARQPAQPTARQHSMAQNASTARHACTARQSTPARHSTAQRIERPVAQTYRGATALDRRCGRHHRCSPRTSQRRRQHASRHKKRSCG